MYSSLGTLPCQVQCSDYIRIHSLDLVVLAPIDIRPPGLSSAVDHVGRFVSIELLTNACCVLHTHRSGVDILALTFKKFVQVACYPAALAPDEEAFFRHGDLRLSWKRRRIVEYHVYIFTMQGTHLATYHSLCQVQHRPFSITDASSYA